MCNMSDHPSDLELSIERLADESVARVATDASASTVADAMITQSRCARYVVVEDDGELAGIITDRDLIASVLASESEFNVWAGDRDEADITAADLMTVDPLTVSADAAVPRVLRQMNEAGARHVPVVEDGTVCGVITLDDLVTHLAGESAHVSAQMDNLAGIIRSESVTE